MAQIKINDFKGLLTYADYSNLEYSPKVENIKFHPGYIETIEVNSSILGDGTLPEGNKVLFYGEITLKEDPLSLSPEPTEVYILIIDTVNGLILKKGDEIIVYKTFENLYFGENVIIENENGIAKIISDSRILYEIRRYNRVLRGEIFKGIYVIPLGYDYFLKSFSFETKLNISINNDEPVKFSNYKFVFPKNQDDRVYFSIKTDNGVYITDLIAIKKLIGEWWIYSTKSEGWSIDNLNILIHETNVTAKFESNIWKIEYQWDDQYPSNAENFVQKLKDKKLEITIKNTVNSTDSKLAFPASITKFKYLVTYILNGEDEVIVTKGEQNYTTSEPFFIKFITEVEEYPNVTGYRIYLKKSGFNNTEERVIEDEDYEEVVNVNLYGNNTLPQYWINWYSGYITNISSTGIILSQNLGVYYDNKLTKINQVEKFTVASNIGFILSNGNVYYSPIGGGNVQKLSYYNATIVPFAIKGAIKDIKKMGEDLVIISDFEILTIMIEIVEGQILFRSRGSIPYVPVMAINSGTQLFILTSKGILHSNGNESPKVISIQINDIIKSSYNAGKIYYDQTNSLLIYQSYVPVTIEGETIAIPKMFMYDFEINTWTEVINRFYYNDIGTFSGLLFQSSIIGAWIKIEEQWKLGKLSFKKGWGNIFFKSNLNELYLKKILKSLTLEIEGENIQVFSGEDGLKQISDEDFVKIYYLPVEKRIPKDFIEFNIKGNFLLKNIEVELDVTPRLRSVGMA